MPAWSIATLDEKHLDDIVTIEEESFRQPWQRISFSNELSRGDAINAVAIESAHGQTIAYACFRLTLEELHLLRVAVAYEWRRQGIAALLLKNCLQEARIKGARAAHLEVRQTNTSARRLYLKIGFQMMATRPGYFMDTGEDAIIMMKVLEEVL